VKKTLQGSFNLSDPFEKELYEFALKQGKSSSYIKRLIYLDKMSKEGTTTLQPTVTIPAETDKKQAAMKATL
jgi:hypothetical protein